MKAPPRETLFVLSSFIFLLGMGQVMSFWSDFGIKLLVIVAAGVGYFIIGALTDPFNPKYLRSQDGDN